MGSLIGADPGQFTLTDSTCTTPVAPGGSCTVQVAFAPTGTGDKTATVRITSNAPSSPDSVALTGAGRKKHQTLTARLPHRIKTSGLTLIIPANTRTNAGQQVRTRIRGGPTGPAASGEVRYFTIVRGPHGKTSVRTFGHPNLKLKVTQTAPATTYPAFTRTVTYTNGKRR